MTASTSSRPVAQMLHDLVPGRLALITDAMAATGLHDGNYHLGSLPVEVTDSVARLVTSDGTQGAIAGSTLTMDDAVKRAVAEVGLSPFDAVQAASLVPLRAVGPPVLLMTAACWRSECRLTCCSSTRA
jgi:N-acetylglucosamine-6-phosphate deacetylase